MDAGLELPVWAGYDRIVSISADVTKNFLKVFPSLSDKIVERPNVVSSKFVKSRAEEVESADVEAEMPKVLGIVNLLSVGRFSHPKNFDSVPDICRRICSEGVDVRWYLIGYGNDEALVRKRITEAGMEDRVLILGKKENPYPYMKACDFYVQPSRYEGSPMTVLEAEALGKPVILTDFPTAKSVVESCRNCRTVPLDNEGCAKGIAGIISK